MKLSRKSAAERKWQLPEKYQLFLMLFPFLVLVFIFSYLPLYGWRYAFYMYRPGFDLSKCEYVGFYWFQSIFSNSYQIKEISRRIKDESILRKWSLTDEQVKSIAEEVLGLK